MHCMFPGGSNFRSGRDVKQLVKTVCTITITRHSSWVQPLHMRSSKSMQRPVRFFSLTKCYFTIWLKCVNPWNSFLMWSDLFLNCSSTPTPLSVRFKDLSPCSEESLLHFKPCVTFCNTQFFSLEDLWTPSTVSGYTVITSATTLCVCKPLATRHSSCCCEKDYWTLA